MCNNNYKILLLILLLATSMSSYAQNDSAGSAIKGNKSFVLYVGGGFSYYTSPVNNPLGEPKSVEKLYPSTTVRIMWHPQYRLRIGIETGTVNFYSYEVSDGVTTGKVDLTGIPVIIMWSMPIVKRLNVYAGIGSYFLTSRLEYKGQVKSKSFSLGSNIALAYQQPISKNLQLALEAKWMNAFVSRNSVAAIQLQLAWKFLEWRSR